MSLLWKVVLPLVLLLPIAAYVAGALASDGPDPGPRETIVIEDAGNDQGTGDRRGGDGRGGQKGDDDGKKGRHDGDDTTTTTDDRDDDGDDDDVDIVERDPDDLDDDSDDN